MEYQIYREKKRGGRRKKKKGKRIGGNLSEQAR
jgi:hypothetical protein